jgi:hypothetical protein
MMDGAFRLSGGEAVIGSELAKDLGLSVGDKLRLATVDDDGPVGPGADADRTGREDVFSVAGVFDLGNKDVNQRWVFVPIKSAQSLLDLPGGVSTIEVRVREYFGADEAARAIAARTGMVADSWTVLNRSLLIGLRSQNASSYMIQLFVVVAVALGIASVLVVSVVQKSKEIGILKAVGTTTGQIRRIFLIQGAIVGLLGSAAGSGLGAALALLFAGMAQNPDGSPTFPVDLTATRFAAAAAVATITGLVSAVAPASRAAKLDPAEAIMAEPAPVLELEQVTKVYGAAVKTHALRGVDLTVRKGEFCALVGPSGRARAPCSTSSACSTGPPPAGCASPGGDHRAGRRGAHPLPRQDPGVRLPVPPPGAGADRGGERDGAELGARGPADGPDAGAGAGAARGGGPVGEGGGALRRPLRRAAAAGGDSPGARGGPAAGARRRADGQPRHRDRGRGLRAPAALQPRAGHELRGGHARPEAGAADGPDRRAGGRANRQRPAVAAREPGRQGGGAGARLASPPLCVARGLLGPAPNEPSGAWGRRSRGRDEACGLRLLLLLTSALAPALPPQAARAHRDLPVQYVERPLTLPRLTLSPWLTVGHSRRIPGYREPEVTALAVGAALGLADYFQLEAVALPLVLGPAFRFGQLQAGATARIAAGPVEFGLNAEVHRALARLPSRAACRCTSRGR